MEHEILKGHSPRVAGTAVKTFADSIQIDRVSLSPYMSSWLATLLSTVHADAALRIARILADRECVQDSSLLPTIPTLTMRTLERMRLAIQRKEDSQVSRELLELLVRLDLVSPLDAGSVLSVYEIVRSRLQSDSVAADDFRVGDQAASVRDLAHLCGTLMAKRLTLLEVRTKIGEVLCSVNLEPFGKKIGKAISSMLIGIGYRDPEAIDWMEEIFGYAGVGFIVQRAIADALLQLAGDHVGSRASQLKNRADCPPAIASYIIGKLRS